MSKRARGLDSPVRPTQQIELIVLEQPVAIAPCSLFDQPVGDEELDGVAGAYGPAMAKRGVCHQRLLIVRREVEVARRGDGDRHFLTGIEPSRGESELRSPTPLLGPRDESCTAIASSSRPA